MLEKILDDAMAKTRQFERTTTKASKFNCQTKNSEEDIANDKLGAYIKKVKVDTRFSLKDMMYDADKLIIENPEEIPVEIEFKSTSGLPFFKSVYMKLLEV